MPTAAGRVDTPPAEPSTAAKGLALRRWRAGWAASLLLAAVFAARVFEHFDDTPLSGTAAGLSGAYVLLGLALPLVARRPGWLAHVYFGLQSALVLGLLWLPPNYDDVSALFAALALQAALVFGRRALVAWIAALVLLMLVPAMFLFGWARGLALMLAPAAGCVILPAYVAAYQEIEAARLESQRLLEELQAAQRRLQAYAAQAEELAAVEARNRLARELHDSVSQTLFSLSLNARAARVYQERDPARLRPQLERLQAMAQEALREIRGLIEHLRPSEVARG
jgi:signal transduction histidine kinase